MSNTQPLMAPRTGGLWTDTDLAAFLSVEVSELDAAVAAIPNAPGALTVGSIRRWDPRAWWSWADPADQFRPPAGTDTDGPLWTFADVCRFLGKSPNSTREFLTEAGDTVPAPVIDGRQRRWYGPDWTNWAATASEPKARPSRGKRSTNALTGRNARV